MLNSHATQELTSPEKRQKSRLIRCCRTPRQLRSSAGARRRIAKLSRETGRRSLTANEREDEGRPLRPSPLSDPRLGDKEQAEKNTKKCFTKNQKMILSLSQKYILLTEFLPPRLVTFRESKKFGTRRPRPVKFLKSFPLIFSEKSLCRIKNYFPPKPPLIRPIEREKFKPSIFFSE